MKAADRLSAVTLFMPLRWPLCIALCAGAAFSSWLFFHPSLYIWKAVYVASDFLQFYQRKIVNKQSNLEKKQTQISFSLPLPGHFPLVLSSPQPVDVISLSGEAAELLSGTRASGSSPWDRVRDKGKLLQVPSLG